MPPRAERAQRPLAVRTGLPPNTFLIVDSTGEQTISNQNLSDGFYYMLFDVAVGQQRGLPQKLYQRIEVKQGVTKLTYTIPTYTVIVSVDKGNVIAVQYDEGCHSCDPSSSDCTNNAFLTTENTIPIVESSPFRSCAAPECRAANATWECDLKIFMTWTGTDSNGNFFESANLRPSRFRQFGIGGFYDAVTAAAQNGINQVVTTGQNIIGGLGG
jgi:hypothetical protein